MKQILTKVSKRIRKDITEPFHLVAARTEQQARVHQACELLRRVIRFMYPSSSLLSLLSLLYSLFTFFVLFCHLIKLKDICRGNSNFTCNPGTPPYQKLPHAYMILVFLFYSLLSLLPLPSLLSLLCFVFLFFFFLLIYVNQAQVRKETDLSGILVVDAEIQWITKAEEEVIANVCSSLPPPLSPLLFFLFFLFLSFRRHGCSQWD